MSKEYVLKIVYSGKSDEIEHLSERFSSGFTIEIDGIDIPITDEMGNYMIEHVEADIIGVT